MYAIRSYYVLAAAFFGGGLVGGIAERVAYWFKPDQVAFPSSGAASLHPPSVLPSIREALVITSYSIHYTKLYAGILLSSQTFTPDSRAEITVLSVGMVMASTLPTRDLAAV